MPEIVNNISRNIAILSKLQKESFGYSKHGFSIKDCRGVGYAYEAEHIYLVKRKLRTLLNSTEGKTLSLILNANLENKEKLDKKRIFNLFREKSLLKEEEDFYAKLFLTLLKSDNVKERGEKVLKKAIQDQNFIFADQLIGSGAPLDQDCENAFAIAMHTNSNIVERYYHCRGTDRFRASDFAVGDFHHHRVRKYGLSLGVKFVAADGTSSGYGYTGPALEELTKRIGLYTNIDQRFTEIYAANVKTLSICNYYGSRVRAEGASRYISDMLQNVCAGGGVVCIPCGFSQHMIGVYVVDGYLVVSDRQARGGHTPGTKIYKITDPNAYSPEVIEKLITGMGKARSREEVMGALLSGVELNPVFSISQKAQKMDNCTIANPKAAIEGVLFLQELRNLTETSIIDIRRVKDIAHSRYKGFTKNFRITTARELREAILADPADSDLSGLVVAYINQQYTRENHDFFSNLYDVLGDEQKENVSAEIRYNMGVDRRNTQGLSTVVDKLDASMSSRINSLIDSFSMSIDQGMLSAHSTSNDSFSGYLPSSLSRAERVKSGCEAGHTKICPSNTNNMLGSLTGGAKVQSLHSPSYNPCEKGKEVIQAGTQENYLSNLVGDKETIAQARIKALKV